MNFTYALHGCFCHSHINTSYELLYEIPVFCNHLEEEENTGCFAIIVLQMYCYYKCSVVLPHGAVGWPAVCDCGIS